MPGLNTSCASNTLRCFSRQSADASQLSGSWASDFSFSSFSFLWIFTLTYVFSAISSALGISKPWRHATARPANSRYNSADPSGERISTVCFCAVSKWLSFSSGLARTHMSVLADHPSGTRTSTERLRSPQHTFVGASWCGTRRKYDVGFVLPKAVIAGASSIIPAIALRAVSESSPLVSIWFLPSLVKRMCTWRPDPALPAVIFGAKVTL